MTQSLSPENQTYLDRQVARGIFASHYEAIDAGVALLRKRDDLVAQLQESRRQLDAGESTEYDDASLAARFDKLKAKAAVRPQT